MNGTPPRPVAPGVARLVRVLGGLTALLPGWMRREWGADLLSTARARLSEAEQRGPGALWTTFGAEVLSLGRAVALARWYRPEFREGRVVMFEDDNGRALRVAWIVALVVHFLAFTLVVPFGTRRIEAAPEKTYTVITSYKPPPPPSEEPVRRVVRRDVTPVPIPDPTPDELELLVSEEYVYESADSEVADVDFLVASPSGPPTPQEVYRVGADIQRPELLDRIVPEYPELALRARLECVVIMEARIDRVGNVVDLQVLRPCGLGLTEAALDAVRQWKYAPTLVNGHPVEVVLTATVTFQLTSG